MKVLPAPEDRAGKPALSLIVKARKAAFAISKRHKYGHGCYDVEDMIQDGCVAALQGRQAYYGCIDGLRSWLHRNHWWKDVPINEALDRSYDPDPLNQIILHQEYERMIAKMDKWRPKKRAAWMLRYEEDKKVREIGKILGVTQGRASQWLKY